MKLNVFIGRHCGTDVAQTADEESKQKSPARPEKHFQFAADECQVKKISDNDLDSVTSSEFDSFSVQSDKRAMPASGQSKESDARAPQTEKRFYQLRAEELDSKASLASEASRNSKGPHSDNEDTLLQMDVCTLEPFVRPCNKGMSGLDGRLAKLSFISIQISIHFDDQFFLIYFKTKLLRMNLKVEHCGAFYAPSNDIC